MEEVSEADQCSCCNADFVAFEEKQSCSKCGVTICRKCVREVKQDLDASTGDARETSSVMCKDCEFMGKWVKDVKAKDKGRFWNLKMPKRIFGLRRTSSSTAGPADKKMPKSLHQKFSMVTNMLEKSRGNPYGSQKSIAIIPSEIQQDLQALSREKLKEIHDQKKLISELQQENERMRNGLGGGDQLHNMKGMIDELKKESEAHIAELQQQVEFLLEQNARLKQVHTLQGSDSDDIQTTAPQLHIQAPPSLPVQSPEDPKFAKYRKMQKAGLPEGAITHAASRDGVELPGDFFTAPAPSAAAAPPALPVVQEDPKFAKYRKMQKAGLPEGAIMQAASRDGVELPGDFFTAPAPAAAAAPPALPVVQEDPKFAKYRKMQKAGLPEGAIMQAASRDGIQLPGDFFTGPIPSAAAPPALPVVQEDPKFAKYRKMQKAGLPEGAIIQAASRDGIQLPGDFFTAPAPAAAAPAPVVQEDPKFAKFRKMQKAGLPEGAIRQAAGRDGIELPGDFFSTTGPSGGVPAPPPLPGMGGPPSAPPMPAAAAAPAEPPKPKSKYEVTKRSDVRKNKEKPLRGIFWNVLPAKRVENSMWVTLPDNPPFAMDGFLQKLETSFAKTEAKKIPALTNTAKEKTSGERPPLLDGKRQQNLGIALARFKEPVGDLKKHILKMDQDFFTMEVVHKLLTMVPTPEEIQAVQAAEGEWSGPGKFTDGLSRVEHFVYEMSSIPRLRQRLQAIFVEMSFERQSECLHEAIVKYEAGCRQLLACQEWKKLLHLVLVAGNYLNSGNKSTGGAWGIEISTGLQKLAQAKSTGNSKYSLLHWLAEVTDQKAPELLDMVNKLDKVEEASTMNLEDLKADLGQLLKGCDLVERELKACSGDTFGVPSDAPGAREFIDIMKPFLLQNAKPVTEQIKKSMAKLESTSSKLLEMHGEIPTKCSASQLLSTALMFCKSLCKARDENELMKVVDSKKKAIEDKRKRPEGQIADALAAKSKQLDKQLKADKISKKLKNSFKKGSTKTKDSLAAVEKLVGENQPLNTAS